MAYWYFFAGTGPSRTHPRALQMFRSAIFQPRRMQPSHWSGSSRRSHITTWTLPFGQEATAAEITLLTQGMTDRDDDSNGRQPDRSLLDQLDSQLTGELADLTPGPSSWAFRTG